jgi:hypothetical protein
VSLGKSLLTPPPNAALHHDPSTGVIHQPSQETNVKYIRSNEYKCLLLVSVIPNDPIVSSSLFE